MQPEQDTLCVDHKPPPTVQLDEATRVWVNRRGYITHIAKRLLRWNGLDTGVFWLTPAVFRAVEALRAVAPFAPTLTQACRWLIERGKGLRACDVSGLFWMDVDTPADLRRTERALEKRSRPLFQPALSRMA